MMDSLKSNDDASATEIVIYATLSCIIVTFICVFLYLTCSKRYKLNWFENNLLETAKENEENAQRFVVDVQSCLTKALSLFTVIHSHEVLVHCGVSFNNESSIAGSSRSLNRNINSPISNHTDDPTFWVPSGTGHCSDIPSGRFYPLSNDFPDN